MTVSKNSNAISIVVVLILLIAVITAVIMINQSNQHKGPAVWSSFVYKNGYTSAAYEMDTDFTDYQSCKVHAQTVSAKYDNAPWQCGSQCRFDSMRQGFECESMMND
ncbi:hypothetical protein Q4601_16065 [Shewanella sp. 1_MG-2023]|jgi:hypothetical protein|uniref:Transmembrane protein n=1 Tax=Shewanella electrodiphila TaxID=934143 RepID=A0ABT0KP59_9GAMM|nr:MULTISPECIES: hypothetical protein [Shewanella]MCL1045326.1 hypothetical protein [Shewanella electrodiphila]MDO6611284.1 hypothetical protein [Shewanella sp. 7_MG-2023]MDO6771139.1 hypothetical protein [Shewanella sp. 2_MG-2023]MDO6795820.1 hypothetical protein [Shewanella sp. 1_MG-2023]PMG73494.1 hypothetical protein BCU84_19220 [Shewanella sp. 10N.286.51.B7]